MTVHYGTHLLGDLAGCEPRLANNGEYLRRFLLKLVSSLGMRAMGEPHLDAYTGPHRGWDGFSATVHIQTSHITLHAFACGYVFLDLFSCVPFDVAAAQELVRRDLGAGAGYRAEWRVVARGYNFPPQLVDPAMRLRAEMEGERA